LAFKLNSKFKIASLAEIQEDMKADFQTTAQKEASKYF
jgi:hypothetical protein